MDKRDKHLNRHMRRRFAIAASLSGDRQRQWALRCVAEAMNQHRTAYYLVARLWLANVNDSLLNTRGSYALN